MITLVRVARDTAIAEANYSGAKTEESKAMSFSTSLIPDAKKKRFAPVHMAIQINAKKGGIQ